MTIAANFDSYWDIPIQLSRVSSAVLELPDSSSPPDRLLPHFAQEREMKGLEYHHHTPQNQALRRVTGVSHRGHLIL